MELEKPRRGGGRGLIVKVGGQSGLGFGDFDLRF